MIARRIKQIGLRGKLRIYWDRVVIEQEPCSECTGGSHKTTRYQDDCPRTYGLGKPGIHNAYTPIGDKLGAEGWGVFGTVEDFAESAWPIECAYCTAPVPKTEDPGIFLQRQVSVARLYDSPSGDPEPGDVYWVKWHGPGHCPHWDNCDGRHLFAITPNGVTWDIDGRASNCTMPKEKTHRCWIRTGTPEDGNVHVGKEGHTCAAGAGSIDVTGWHGFLHGFSWNGC